MSDDVVITDDGDIEVEIKRTPKGRFAKGTSGNPFGRAGKSGKASSNKINKAKAVSALNKNFNIAVLGLMRVTKKAEDRGQLSTAMKGYVSVIQEYTKLLVHQDKLAMETKKIAKALQEAEDNQDDESSEVQEAILSFQQYTGTE